MMKGIIYDEFQRRFADALSEPCDIAAARSAIEEYIQPLVSDAEEHTYSASATGLLEAHLEGVREAVLANARVLGEPEIAELREPIDLAIARCNSLGAASRRE